MCLYMSGGVSKMAEGGDVLEVLQDSSVTAIAEGSEVDNRRPTTQACWHCETENPSKPSNLIA